MRQAQAATGATYALALAGTYEPARGLVEWVFRSPQWRQALTPVVRRLAPAGATGPKAMAAEAETGVVRCLAWRPPSRGAGSGAWSGPR